MEDAELSAGRWSGLTVLTIVVLGSWVLSARHSGWIDVGLLGLLPDAILFPLVLLVLNKCGFGTRAVMITTLIMVVGFLSFWILCVTYALTATWWAAIATSVVGAGLLFELAKRYLRNRAQLRAEEVSARGGANRQIDARRSKQKNRSPSHDPLSSDAHAPRLAASQYTSQSRTAVRGRPSRQPASDPAPKPRSSDSTRTSLGRGNAPPAHAAHAQRRPATVRSAPTGMLRPLPRRDARNSVHLRRPIRRASPLPLKWQPPARPGRATSPGLSGPRRPPVPGRPRPSDRSRS